MQNGDLLSFSFWELIQGRDCSGLGSRWQRGERLFHLHSVCIECKTAKWWGSLLCLQVGKRRGAGDSLRARGKAMGPG